MQQHLQPISSTPDNETPRALCSRACPLWSDSGGDTCDAHPLGQHRHPRVKPIRSAWGDDHRSRSDACFSGRWCRCMCPTAAEARSDNVREAKEPHRNCRFSHIAARHPDRDLLAQALESPPCVRHLPELELTYELGICENLDRRAYLAVVSRGISDEMAVEGARGRNHAVKQFIELSSLRGRHRPGDYRAHRFDRTLAGKRRIELVVPWLRIRSLAVDHRDAGTPLKVGVEC